MMIINFYHFFSEKNLKMKNKIIIVIENEWNANKKKYLRVISGLCCYGFEWFIVIIIIVAVIDVANNSWLDIFVTGLETDKSVE